MYRLLFQGCPFDTYRSLLSGTVGVAMTVFWRSHCITIWNNIYDPCIVSVWFLKKIYYGNFFREQQFLMTGTIYQCRHWQECGVASRW